MKTVINRSEKAAYVGNISPDLDLLVNHRSEVLSTETYKAMINGDGIQDVSYSENVLTVTCSFGIKYKFAIEFTKDGDRINKITYIK